jgi:hypothetical protein
MDVHGHVHGRGCQAVSSTNGSHSMIPRPRLIRCLPCCGARASWHAAVPIQSLADSPADIRLTVLPMGVPAPGACHPGPGARALPGGGSSHCWDGPAHGRTHPGPGRQVALVDAGMTLQVTPIVATAKACRIAPAVFLRRVHLVRAFTCWQLTTLRCERPQPLLATHPIGLVILLEPLSAFFEGDVTAKEARADFQHERIPPKHVG